MEVHPFEKAGLGKAPFRCVGLDEKVGPYPTGDGMTTVGAPGQPVGCCKYCGAGIRYCFLIKSADGKFFDVGSDCVMKTTDPSTITDFERTLAVLKKTISQEKSKKRKVIEEEIIRNAKETFFNNDFSYRIQHKPHPYGIPNKDLADYIRYLFQNGGHSGKMRAARIVDRELKELGAAERRNP